MRPFVDALVAIVPSLLPRRHWEAIDLPVQAMVPVSGLLTLLAGLGFGLNGFVAYSHQVANTAGIEFMPPPLMLLTGFTFAFFTPTGLLCGYLMASGLIRAVSWWIDEPFGDPVLTGIDTLIHRTRHSAAARSSHRTRTTAEGTDEPDRRYPGPWADLPDVDFVVVAARRKAGWTAGTFVITPDGWFRLGQPFDRPMANGLRTIYPLTALQTLDVLRKGVSYELPPLRLYAPRRAVAPAGPSGTRGES